MGTREQQSGDAAASARDVDDEAAPAQGPLQFVIERFGPAGAQKILQQKREQRRAARDKETAAARLPGAGSAGGMSWAVPVRVRVTADGLHVRSSPQLGDGNIVGGYYRGHELDAIGRDGDWLMVSYKGAFAYVHSHYVEPVAGAHGEAAPAPAAAHQPAATHVEHRAAAPAKPLESQAAHHDPAPAAAAATAAAKPADSAAPQKEPTKAGQPEAPVRPPVDKSFDEVLRLAAATNNRQAALVAQELRQLRADFEALPTANHNEQVGKRAQLVEDIRTIRAHIAQLANAGIDPAKLVELQGGLYRAVDDLAPYYHQANADILYLDVKDKKTQKTKHWAAVTRTCNLTSLSMALESLGKSAKDYKGDQDKVCAAAKVFHGELGKDAGTTWAAVQKLRLPDFIELAVVAEHMSDSSEAAVIPARDKAAGGIANVYFVEGMAKCFGATPQVKFFDRGAAKPAGQKQADHALLNDYGEEGGRRLTVMSAVSKGAKDGKAYREAMSDEGIKTKLSIESYKEAIMTQVGGELASGAAVVVGMTGHFVRLQAIHDEHIIIDDPGSWDNHDLKLTWEEARAVGCFWNRVVMR
jgi:hypothetical protein